jgi:hypothetical protein
VGVRDVDTYCYWQAHADAEIWIDAESSSHSRAETGAWDEVRNVKP